MCAPPADIIATLRNTRIRRRECALAAADSARPIACAATPKAGFTLRAETSRTFRVTDPRVACAALGVAGAVTGGPPSRSPCPMLGILRGTNLRATGQERGIAGTCVARWNTLAAGARQRRSESAGALKTRSQGAPQDGKYVQEQRRQARANVRAGVGVGVGGQDTDRNEAREKYAPSGGYFPPGGAKYTRLRG